MKENMKCPKCGRDTEWLRALSRVDNKTSSEHKIGDVVQFNGGYHYVNSTASKPTGSRCNAGPAKITHIAKGKAHPWHLEHTDSKSRVSRSAAAAMLCSMLDT